MLAQQGKLSLDDDIRKWIPEVPDFGKTITVRHLIHHTSGLRDYFGLLGMTGWPSDGPVTEARFLDLVSRQKALNFDPGSRHLYSNTGYVLLSILVKRVSGQSLREFADQAIFGPLGMSNSHFRDDHTDAREEPRARVFAARGTGGSWTCRASTSSATAASSPRSTIWRSGRATSTITRSAATSSPRACSRAVA